MSPFKHTFSYIWANSRSDEKSIYAYAHPADPVNSLLQSRSATKLSRPLCRFYKVPIPWGDPGEGPRGPKGDPKGTQGEPKGPKGTQREPRDPKDPKGPKGNQGDPRDPRAPLAPFGGWILWGYSEAIPNGKPFRAEGYYERKPAPK